MNFVQLVEEMLLTEDPDSARFCYDDPMGACPQDDDQLKSNIDYEDLHFEGNDNSTFELIDILFKRPKKYTKTALFYSKFGEGAQMDHYGLRWLIQHSENLELWNCFPSEMKQEIIDSFKMVDKSKVDEKDESSLPYTFSKAGNPRGRYWIAKERFFVSMWAGEEEIIKKWLKIANPVWNPNNFPFFYQAPGEKWDHWIDGNDFINSKSSAPVIRTPEIIDLEKQINQLIPQVHTSSGQEKQKIKNQITDLQSKIKSLGGTSKSTEDIITAKGSYKQAQIAGKMSVAQMNSLRQTSESFSSK
jgi:hypothetical protein